MCKRALFSGFFLLLLTGVCDASEHLLYLESQAVGGYSTGEDKWVTYSRTKEDVMQEPSVGFDYLQRFSGETGDLGVLAIQARLAYSQREDETIEPQLFNAYFRLKTAPADLWVGHARPSMGLSSYYDTHGLLIQTLSMNGFGFDRDWGLGVYRDLSWGNAGFSLTTGSGMPARFNGNYLASTRVSKGVLSRDNYNLGFSLSYGQVLETVGYEVIDGEPRELALAGVDFTYLWDRYESRFEVMGGRNLGQDAYALFYRFGVNLMEEGRLKLEAQPVFTKIGENEDFQFSAGPSFILTKDLTLRGMYLYDNPEGRQDDHRFILQLYLYKRL